MTIFQDIKTAVKMTREIRRARMGGANAIQVRPIYKVPVVRFGYFTSTMEACILRGDEFKAVCAVFETLPEETQHALTCFSPEEPGDWAARARFWQNLLKPALPPKMYHGAMMKVIGRYAHCLRARKEAVTV